MAAYQRNHYGNPCNLNYRMYEENYHGKPEDRPLSWRQVAPGSRSRVGKAYNQLARLVGDSDLAVYNHVLIGRDNDGLTTYRIA